MKPFYLKVVASDKVFFDGMCVSLVIPIDDGSMGILADHENTVMVIEPGEICIKSEQGEEIHAFVGDGFVEIINGEVVVVVISCEKPEDIDVDRAKNALQRAREEIRQQHSVQEHNHALASIARAMERLKLIEKYKRN